MPSLRYHVCQFSSKTNNFDFFDLNLPKNWFWGWNFKNLSAGSRSAPSRDHFCQVLVKMGNFEFFNLSLGNCPIKSNILVLPTLRVLQRAGWKLKMNWVEVGVWFSNTYFFNLKKKWYFSLEMSRFLCFCEIHRFYNLWRHHRHSW